MNYPEELYPLEPEHPLKLSIENQNAMALALEAEAKRNIELMSAHQFPWLFLILVSGGILAWFWWRYFMPQRRIYAPQSRITPKKKAIAALESIQKNFGSNEVEFICSLSDVLRRYIEEQFIFFGSSETTNEYLQDLSKHGRFSQEFKMLLRSIYEEADRVKFANYQPSKEDVERTYQNAIKLLELT